MYVCVYISIQVLQRKMLAPAWFLSLEAFSGFAEKTRIAGLGAWENNVSLSLFKFLKALQKLGFVRFYKSCVVFVFTSNCYTYIHLRIL